MGLKTTTVGWFPKPVELRRARWKFAEGELELDALQAIERGATESVVKQQRDLGLDLLVDGQMDRGDAAASYADRLEGMETGGLVRCFGNRYYRKPRIVGEIARPEPLGVAHWKAAADAAGGDVKAILTGPYTLMDWSFDEHYGSRERCCLALADALHAEVQELVEAGAQEIQLEDPAIGVRPEEMSLVAESLRRVTDGVAGKARTWIYVGYGDLGPVAQQLVTLPVDGLLLQTARSDEVLLEALGGATDKQIGVGVVDVHTDDVETPDELRARVERVLEKVAAERLWLMPDAGLRTLSPAAVEGKLRGLVAAAAAS